MSKRNLLINFLLLTLLSAGLSSCSKDNEVIAVPSQGAGGGGGAGGNGGAGGDAVRNDGEIAPFWEQTQLSDMVVDSSFNALRTHLRQGTTRIKFRINGQPRLNVTESGWNNNIAVGRAMNQLQQAGMLELDSGLVIEKKYMGIDMLNLSNGLYSDCVMSSKTTHTILESDGTSFITNRRHNSSSIDIKSACESIGDQQLSGVFSGLNDLYRKELSLDQIGSELSNIMIKRKNIGNQQIVFSITGEAYSFKFGRMVNINYIVLLNNGNNYRVLVKSLTQDNGLVLESSLYRYRRSNNQARPRRRNNARMAATAELTEF